MIDDDVEQEHLTRNLVLSACDLKQHGESPSERLGAAAVTLGTRLYLHGGCTSQRVFDDLNLLELERMQWSLLPHTGQNKPGARYFHTMETHNNHLICFGGMCSEGTGSDLLAGGGGSSGSNQLGVMSQGTPGGKVDNGSVYTMEAQTLIWTSFAPKPEYARYGHSSAIADDLMVCFGGINGEGRTLNDLVMFDLINKSWRTPSPSPSGSSPTPRFGHSSTFVPATNEVLIFGGLLEDSQVYAYSLPSSSNSNGMWTTIQTQGTSPLPRLFHSMNLIQNRIFVFGGKTMNGLSDLYILEISNGTDGGSKSNPPSADQAPTSYRWKKPLYDGAVSVRAHSSSILHDKLIVFGGVRDKRDSRTDVITEEKVSKKLFFLNVLQIREGVSGAGGEGDFKFKLVTVGDSGVGKSCLLTRFVQDFYSDFHVSTIGVDFKTVTTMVKGKLVKLQLWDTAGQERFSVVTGNYYRGSDGFIFVYDCTSRTSFQHVDQWLSQVQQHHDCGPDCVKILVGNKADLKDKIQVTEAEGMVKANELGAIFMSCSAKTSANVDLAFLSAATNLVETRKAQAARGQSAMGSQGPSGIGLTASSGGNSNSSGSGSTKCNACAAK